MNENEEIQLSLDDARAVVELGEAAKKLAKNREFRKVFIKEFFENEAIRLVSVLSNPGMQAETTQQNITSRMKAISETQQFLNQLVQKGEQMKADIIAYEQEMHQADSE